MIVCRGLKNRSIANDGSRPALSWRALEGNRRGYEDVVSDTTIALKGIVEQELHQIVSKIAKIVIDLLFAACDFFESCRRRWAESEAEAVKYDFACISKSFQHRHLDRELEEEQHFDKDHHHEAPATAVPSGLD